MGFIEFSIIFQIITEISFTEISFQSEKYYYSRARLNLDVSVVNLAQIIVLIFYRFLLINF